MQSAIEVREIGKRYRLGITTQRLDERVNSILMSPIRRVRGARGQVAEAHDAEEFWALRNCSAHVDPGEIVGLIGSNGAGKSTLLKLLSRITLPTEGEITIRGRVASLLEVGTGFHPELTGRENTFLNGAILGMSEAEVRAKFDDIVAFSGIEQFLDTPVKRYSSGMFVRLAFAVAAHLEPEILLVDEVLAVGDVEFQRKCLGKMQDVSRGGRTIVFVSHNMSAIKRLCGRAYWLEGGGVRMVGPAGEVVDAYLREHQPISGEGFARFDDATRRIGTPEASFQTLSLCGPEGEPTASIGLGEELRVRAELTVASPIEEAVLEVGISTTDAERVVTIQSIDFGRPAQRLAPGTYTLDVELGVQMLPGEFGIDIGVHHLDGRTIDAIDRALHFTVINASPDNPDDHYRWTTVRGYVRAPSHFSLAPSIDARTALIGR